MDPAVSILDRSLKGDAGALSFLERTAAIYVYDCTSQAPKICGAWDFLNQALTEVERYESRLAHWHALGQTNGYGNVNLEAHVQLLATMSRRAARRCPASDQRLVELALSNAAHFHEHGSNEHARHLIDINRQMRDRVMGRIAAIAFDFTNHRRRANVNGNAYTQTETAFSHPVTMDSLCAIVAANAISTGPHEFTNLVLDWIIPSLNNLPPFSVAAVVYHLAAEALGKSAPAGTKLALQQLFDPVLSKVLAPMLQEAVNDSDNGDDGNDGMGVVGDRTNSHRIAAITLKALERWCAATACSISRVRQVCQAVNINIIATISDAMYSDSELVMDALSELLDTLLRQHAEDQNAIQGLAIAGSVMKGISAASFQSPTTMLQFEKELAAAVQERDAILSELVSAVGMQRFRFSSRLSSGDSGVCRCLTSIALSIADASQPLLRSGKLQGAENGMIDLLMKASSHPSLNVYSLALDAFKFIIGPSSDVPTRLLPILQGKAIAPQSLVGLTSDINVDVDFDEFERFREHQLADILASCYINCRSYYMESCCIAIEEFCSGTPNPHTPFQLEAALFCLCAVSVDASKRALLVKASPAAQSAAAKACASQHPGSSLVDVSAIAEDAKHHDEKLARCVLAIANCPGIGSFNNPLLLSQLCRLLGKYANWLSKTPSEGVLDAAAALSLSCFNEAASKFGQDSDISEDMEVSPFAEAASALRNILSRAPTRFANADALAALENGWRSVYTSPCDDHSVVSIDDRKALCTGITRVLAVLSPDQWPSSLSTLASPTIECIETLLQSINETHGSPYNAKLEQYISRMSEEICVLASALRSFHSFAKKQPNSSSAQVKNPLLALLHRVWPCVTHIAKTFSSHEIVISSLSEFLLIVISLNDEGNDVALLTEACEIAVAIMDVASQQEKQSCNLLPIMEFVEEMIDIFGLQAEGQATNTIPTNELTKQIQTIVEHLIRKSFRVIRGQTEQANVDALPGLFSICRACIRRCPILFMSLNVSTDEPNSESICAASLNAAMSFVNNRQVDVVRAAMLYLNETFVLSAVSDKPMDHRNTAAKKCAEILNPIRGELLSALITGACGIFPREVLDPAGSLLHSMLRSTEAIEAERICTQALQNESFRLGDDAKRATLLTLGKGTRDSISSSVLMDLLDDLWTMHQSDDTGGTVSGGDAIISFAKKYN